MLVYVIEPYCKVLPC